MKQLFTILLFFGFLLQAAGQSPLTDSLKKVLDRSPSGIDRVRTMNLLSDAYKVSDPKMMRYYGNKALALARKLQFKTEEGNALLNLGNADIISGDYLQAINHFSAAQHIFEAIPPDQVTDQSQKSLAKAYGSIGIVLAEQSNYSKALQYHFKAVALYEKTKDLIKSAQVYNNIGVSYQSLSDDKRALDYFLKAYALQRQAADPYIGVTLTNIANCHYRQRNMPQALKFYQKAKAFLDNSQDGRSLGEWYNNVGLFYQAAGNPAEANRNWQRAIETFNKIGDKFGLTTTHIYLGEFLLGRGETARALQNAQKALALAKELDVLEHIVAAEKLLSDIYKKQGNIPEAFAHHQNYSIAKDSLNNVENIRKGLELAMNLELEKKEVLQRGELEKKELLLQQQSRQNKMALALTSLILVMLAGIGFLFYNRTQLKKRLTLEKELAEYEQKALHLQMNPHFVFNCLGSISSFIVKNGKEPAIRYLAKFSKLMRLTLEYSKQSLIPIDKEIQSLQNYLELEQLRFNHKFDFTITKDKAIEDDLALPPLLLQPFVENAIIHGIIPNKAPGLISIAFAIENDYLVCTISDNGIGYNRSLAIKQKSVSVHQSMALDITKKRLEMIAVSTAQNAKVYIAETHSENNKTTGTKVILTLPVQYIKK